MALVTTGHALCADITDFLLVVADDGTMRNCADPSRSGTLTNGAAYTETLEAAVPHAFFTKAVSFAGGNDLVTFNQTAAYDPSTHICCVLSRNLGALEGLWHHRQSGQNNGICGYTNNNPNVFFVADGVGSESYPPAPLSTDAYYVIAHICPAASDPGGFSALFNSSNNIAGEMGTTEPDLIGTGTPQVIELGNYRAAFGLDGLMLFYIRFGVQKSEADINAVIADARNGFALMLEDDEAGGSPAATSLSGSPLSAALLMPTYYP